MSEYLVSEDIAKLLASMDKEEQQEELTRLYLLSRIDLDTYLEEIEKRRLRLEFDYLDKRRYPAGFFSALVAA